MHRKMSKLIGIIGITLILLLVPALALYAAQEPIQLKWWVLSGLMIDSPYGDFLGEFKEDMLEKHNIDLVLEPKGLKNYDELFVTANLAQEGYDLAHDWSGPTLQIRGRAGNYLALNKYLPKEEFGNITGIGACYVDDNLYAVPFAVGVYTVITNKILFRQAGLDPESFPKTWDDFLDLCQKLKDAGITPLVFANKGGYVNEVIFAALAIQNFNSVEEMQKEIVGPDGTYTDPRIVDFLEKYKALLDQGYFFEGGMSIGWGDGFTPQIVGNHAAINIYGTLRGYSTVREALGEENVGLVLAPMYGKGELKDAVPVYAQVVGVAPWTKHPEAAATVLKELLSVEYQNRALELAASTPVNPDWDRSLIKDPNLKFVYDRMSQKSVSGFYALYSYPVWQAQIRYLSLYLLGDMSAVEALKKMDEAKEE